MSMSVLNNSAAQISLGELNKSINKLGKALAVVASGQKLNSAKDDSAAFAVSEQMRSKLRALEQDVQNVQNGSTMLKTAEGGIQNVVDELRELKDIAIDAANDSNTDDDRRVLQKMFDQKRANIEDIAISTNYNGKRLLDGTYARPTDDVAYHQVGIYTRTTIVAKPPGVTKVPGTSGTAILQDNKWPDIYDPFDPIDSSVKELRTGVRSGSGVECDFGFDGYKSDWNWASAFENEGAADIYGTEYFSKTGASQKEVIEGFMRSLDASARINADDALNDAVRQSSGGKFADFDDLKTQFLSDLQSNPGTFLTGFCGIDLGNTDTGAITGADAGGSTKTAEDIVPENNFSSWSDPTPGSSSTFNGLTVNWPSRGASGTLTATEEAILRGLNSDWIQQGLDLINDSYGMNFQETGDTAFGAPSLNTLNVVFKNSSDNRAAYVDTTDKELRLVVNTQRCDNLVTPYEQNGQVGTEYLDRTVARELTKAVMKANVKNYDNLPRSVQEGIADLTHGADDIRADEIRALVADPSSLGNALSSNSTSSRNDAAAAGYMLMRYLAKQSEGSNISLKQVEYSTEPRAANQIGVKIEFDLSQVPSLSDLHEEGFAILCGGCGQYMNFTFDTSIGVSDSTFVRDSTDRDKGDYVIGIRDVDLSVEHDLAKAIFEGVANCALEDRNSTGGREVDKQDIYALDSSATPPTSAIVNAVVDGNHGLRVARNPSGEGYVFLKDNGPMMDFITKGRILAVEYPGETDDLFEPDEKSIPIVEETEITIGAPIYEYSEYHKKGRPLTIHHGTKSNEAINVYIGSMRTSALRSPIPNINDLERLLKSNEFVSNNRGLVEKTSELKTALEGMKDNVGKIKQSPLVEIINKLDEELSLEIQNKTLRLDSALNDYPLLRRIFEGSVVRTADDTDSDTSTASSDSDTTNYRVFDIDVFVGNLRDNPSLQPMLESAIINQEILRNDNPTAVGNSVDILRNAAGKSIDDVSLVPRISAQAAIRIVDGALTYALGEATDVGAYLARLEYTESNLNVGVENTQAAESTIRDADMARAFTEYTRQNVLMQASQSMLAQANQNASSVLSLLQ